MKIVVIHPDARVRESLVKWLEEQNHAVLEAESQIVSWPASLAEHEPDLVLLPKGQEDNVELIMARSSFPDCQFLFLRADDEDQEPLLRQAEEAYENRRMESRGYAEERRIIIHDEAYRVYAAEGKLHRPKQEPGWEKVATQQEIHFVLQLQAGAAGGHERAKRYLSVLRRSHRHLLQESAYRLGHQSYKISWLREELGRWLTVLCHYLPGADLAACPPPQNASKEFVFLHHEMPPTYLYPLICVLRYGIQPQLSKLLIKATSWRYTGQPPDELAEIGAILFGLNAYLAQIAQAQIWSMNQFLDADSEFHLQHGVDRGLHRAIGAYLEFWGWHYLLGMGNNLGTITSSVLTGETRVESRDGTHIVPSFKEFREAMRQPPTS